MNELREYHYEGFRRWLESQDGSYQTADNTRCPLANFGRSKGFRGPVATLTKVRDDFAPPASPTPELRIVHGLDMKLFAAILQTPHTYEALRRRLDETYTKTGLPRRKPKGPGRSVPYPSVLTGSFKRGAVG